MADTLYDHSVYGFNGSEIACDCTRRTWRSLKQFATHQAEVLAANGYGKLEDAWDEGATAATGHHDTGYPITNPYRRPE